MKSTLQKIEFVAFAITLTCLASLPAMAQEQGAFERTLKVSGPVDLDVSTGSGSIDIHSGSNSTVSVKARIQASRNGWIFGDGDQAERIKRIEQNPPVEQSGNNIRIGHISDEELRRNISISYDIIVPQPTRVVSKTGSGSQTVRDVGGPVRANTGSGTLRISNIGAEVHAGTGSGSIDLSGVKGYAYCTTGSGSIHATGIAGGFSGRTGSGDVRFAQTAAGSVKIDTGSGSIEARNVNGSLEIGTGSGHVEADGTPAGEWRVHTASGRVNLRLPQNANFDLHAHAGSGHVNVDRQVTIQGTFRRNEINGKVGSGGVLVEVRTGSGSIDIS